MNADLTNDILQALVCASAEQKRLALQALRGVQILPEPTVEPYMTLREVALKLNFDPSTLWRWRIPKRSLGGRPRFLLSEVRAYIDSPEFQKKAKLIRLEREDKRKALATATATGGLS